MIAVNNLDKTFNGKKVADNITLKALSKEILCLVGPSGCGKTTLLRMIAGFERPDKGVVLIDDRIVGTPSQNVSPNKRHISFIFQDLALWPHMTVSSHLSFAMPRNKRRSKADKKQAIHDLLVQVGLDSYKDRYPHQLSGGERQRLAIARGLASNPRYLLMDEPFNNLDPVLKDELGRFLLALLETRSMGIIYVTHNTEEVVMLGDKIAVMNKGRLVQLGTPDQVCSQTEDTFVNKLLRR